MKIAITASLFFLVGAPCFGMDLHTKAECMPNIKSAYDKLLLIDTTYKDTIGTKFELDYTLQNVIDLIPMAKDILRHATPEDNEELKKIAIGTREILMKLYTRRKNIIRDFVDIFEEVYNPTQIKIDEPCASKIIEHMRYMIWDVSLFEELESVVASKYKLFSFGKEPFPKEEIRRAIEELINKKLTN